MELSFSQQLVMNGPAVTSALRIFMNEYNDLPPENVITRRNVEYLPTFSVVGKYMPYEE